MFPLVEISRNQYLKLARLPIPPHPRGRSSGFQRFDSCETEKNGDPLREASVAGKGGSHA